MSDRDVMQQALEALEAMNPYPATKADQRASAIEALRVRLAEPEPEPAFWRYKGDPPIWDRHKGEWIDHFYFTANKVLAMLKDNNPTSLYTAPPARRPLTDDEISVLWRDTVNRLDVATTPALIRAFARAIERKITGGNDD